MNWNLIIKLSAFGILMGALTVFGIIPNGFEFFVWLIIAVVSAFIVSKHMKKLIITQSVVIGLFMGILASVIQSVFFETYIKNNPVSLDGFKDIPTAMEPQYVLLFSGPFIGIIFGVVIGLIALGFKKLKK